MKLAIIGGSLLSELTGLANSDQERVTTPFGLPSDAFTRGELNGIDVVYFNRHGNAHHIAPHQINYKANMFALKILDVSHVIAVTAVGGISEKMSPMKWVVPDQIIDYTHGRLHTYNDGSETAVNHIDFSYPFDKDLSNALLQAVTMASDKAESSAVYGVTQGPRLETAAEITRMQRDGCDIVGMTAMPEAAFARELEMKYAVLSLVVNWAAGKGEASSLVSMDEIQQRIAQGNKTAENIIQNVTSHLK